MNVYGEHLKDKRIAFMVTNDVTSYNAPKYINELRRYSADVIPYTIDKNDYISSDILKWSSDNELLDINYISNIDVIIVYKATLSNIDNIINLMPKDKKIILLSNDINEYNGISIVNCGLDTDIDANNAVVEVIRLLSDSCIKNVKILVTAGPTPVRIDNVRRLTNKFSGKLGIEIANELYLRGAQVTLYQSYSGIRPPKYIPQVLFNDYDEYRNLCVNNCNNFDIGIFSAAVADYKPINVFEGKIPSGGVLKSIEFTQTEKVINLVRNINPKLKMISFKYEEGKTLEQLKDIAHKRLRLGHTMVVANDLSLNEEEQKCFMCELDNNDEVYVSNVSIGKVNIARQIANKIENVSKGN